MRQFLRQSILGVLALMGVWLMPPSAFAADGPPTVFYVYMKMGDQSDLVKIDTEADTLTKVMSINTADDWGGYPFIEWEILPVTVADFLPPEEWQAFWRDVRSAPADVYAGIVEDMSAPGIDTKIEAIWEVRPDQLLLYRRFSKCYSERPGPESNCYGMTQFSLLDTQTAQEHVIWTLPFHQDQNLRGGPCYNDILFENFSGREPVDQVLIHPTRTLVGVQFHSYGGCPDAVFLIDYSLEIATVNQFNGLTSMAWSPDGTQLAYMEECPYPEYRHYRHRVCADAFGVIDLDTMQIVFFNELEEGEGGWIAWPTQDTLIFAHLDHETWLQSIVWYNLTEKTKMSFTLAEQERIYMVISLRDQGAHVIYGNGSNGLNSSPNRVFDETPGIWHEVIEDVSWPAGSNGANGSYILLSYRGEEHSLLDAHLNRYPMDSLFADYRDRYGATGIAFAFVGVERP